MGLFDKIKENAKDISKRAIESTREYEEGFEADGSTAEPASQTVPAAYSAQDDTATDTLTGQATPPEDEDAGFYLDLDEQQPPQETYTATAAPEDTADKIEKPARRSRVTEISKEEHEKAEKEKRQEKTKQAAKERLAKSYTPSYKSKDKGKIEVTDKDDEAKDKKPAKKALPKARPVGIVDITPKKMQDPLKGAIYARERAALSALASQRKLNGAVSLYTATHMNFKTRVFINRIEYSGSFGKTVLPIENISWVKVRYGGTGVIVETSEGKRVVMVIKQADRLPFVDAVMKIQAMQPKRAKFKDTQTVRIDKLEQFGEGIDEIEKLAKLYDKGILSHDEFEAKKKQILGL